MASTNSEGLAIHYEVTGDGPPLVLVHGWSASSQTNFHAFGWVDYLRPTYRLIMPDLRGHGRSSKPWRRSAYSTARMADDVIAVLDAERIECASLLGYSTGSQVAVELLQRYPERFVAAVLGGLGAEFHFGWGRSFVPEDGQRRPRVDWFPRRNARAFLHWLRNDPVALVIAFVALYHGRPPVEAERLAEIRAPVLVVTGTRDGFARSSRDLAARIHGAEVAFISGRNHATTIGDRRFKHVAGAFLDRFKESAAQPTGDTPR
jgi:pimeloyl-ACP methyl ester carboxylesterase